MDQFSNGQLLPVTRHRLIHKSIYLLACVACFLPTVGSALIRQENVHQAKRDEVGLSSAFEAEQRRLEVRAQLSEARIENEIIQPASQILVPDYSYSEQPPVLSGQLVNPEKDQPVYDQHGVCVGVLLKDGRFIFKGNNSEACYGFEQ